MKHCLTTLFCFVSFVMYGCSHRIPTPNFYGCFLWDGNRLQELGKIPELVKSQVRDGGTSDASFDGLVLKAVTTDLKPTVICYDADLSLHEEVMFVPIIKDRGKWMLPDFDFKLSNLIREVSTRRGPVHSNPKMIRYVPTEQLQPGTYAVADDGHALEWQYVFTVK